MTRTLKHLTAAATLLALATTAALPTLARADTHNAGRPERPAPAAPRANDPRDDRRNDIRRPDNDRRDYDRRDDHDNRPRTNLSFRTGPVYRAPIVVAPAPQQVWVAPVYRTVTEQVWVAPAYRTVIDRVWREPVVQRTTERIFVPDRYEYRDVPHTDARGRTFYTREYVLVAPAHYEDRPVDTVITPGHWEDVPRQELLCAGHYESVSRQELVTPGYWQTVYPAVAIADPCPPPRAESRFNLNIRW